MGTTAHASPHRYTVIFVNEASLMTKHVNITLLHVNMYLVSWSEMCILSKGKQGCQH